MKVFLSDTDISFILFPGVTRIQNLDVPYTNKTILYILRSSEKMPEVEKLISSFVKNYILITQNPSQSVDTTLNSRMDYIRYISLTYGISEQKSLEKKVDMLSDNDFTNFVKLSILLKRWYKELFSIHEKVYRLFEAVYQSKKEFISLYCDLKKSYSEQELFSSMLTFLSRIGSYEEQKETLSPYYRDVLRKARDQSFNIKEALVSTVSLSNDIPLENRFLGFYMSLKG